MPSQGSRETMPTASADVSSPTSNSSDLSLDRCSDGGSDGSSNGASDSYTGGSDRTQDGIPNHYSNGSANRNLKGAAELYKSAIDLLQTHQATQKATLQQCKYLLIQLAVLSNSCTCAICERSAERALRGEDETHSSAQMANLCARLVAGRKQINSRINKTLAKLYGQALSGTKPAAVKYEHTLALAACELVMLLAFYAGINEIIHSTAGNTANAASAEPSGMPSSDSPTSDFPVSDGGEQRAASPNQIDNDVNAQPERLPAFEVNYSVHQEACIDEIDTLFQEQLQRIRDAGELAASALKLVQPNRNHTRSGFGPVRTRNWGNRHGEAVGGKMFYVLLGTLPHALPATLPAIPHHIAELTGHEPAFFRWATLCNRKLGLYVEDKLN